MTTTEFKPNVGTYVKPDGWPIGSCLLAGDSFSTFRIPVHCGGPITDIACEIEVTGRTVQRIAGLDMIRCKVTFVGDCEPDTVVRGYMEIAW